MEKRGRETKKETEGRVGEEKKSPPLLSYSEKREEHRRRGRGEDIEYRRERGEDIIVVVCSNSFNTFIIPHLEQ